MEKRAVEIMQECQEAINNQKLTSKEIVDTLERKYIRLD